MALIFPFTVKKRRRRIGKERGTKDESEARESMEERAVREREVNCYLK